MLALPPCSAGCGRRRRHSAASSTVSPRQRPTVPRRRRPRMVCGEEIHARSPRCCRCTRRAGGRDLGHLGLHLHPPTPDGAAGPVGPGLPSTTAAGARFDTRRPRRPDPPAAGLGNTPSRRRTGRFVLKDNMTLTVDATRLPAVLGYNGQQRNDLANEIASVVLGCWTGRRMSIPTPRPSGPRSTETGEDTPWSTQGVPGSAGPGPSAIGLPCRRRPVARAGRPRRLR